MPKFQLKAIINRKIYNTETAEEIDYFNNGLSYSNFNYYEEALYRKQNGEFFLAGTGGPLTKYATIFSDSTRGGGTMIIPITVENAKDWIEHHCDIDTYLKYFTAEE